MSLVNDSIATDKAVNMPAPSNERRVALVGVTKDLFESMFRELPPDQWHRFEGLPGDAQFERLDYEVATGTYWLTFSHPSFPATRPGEPLTVLNLQIRGAKNPVTETPMVLTEEQKKAKENYLKSAVEAQKGR